MIKSKWNKPWIHHFQLSEVNYIRLGSGHWSPLAGVILRARCQEIFCIESLTCHPKACWNLKPQEMLWIATWKEKLRHWLFLVQAGVMVTCWSWIRISKDFHPTGSETQTRQQDPKTVKRRFGPIPSRFSFIVFIILSFRGPSGHLGGVSLSLQPNHATAARVRASQGLEVCNASIIFARRRSRLSHIRCRDLVMSCDKRSSWHSWLEVQA